MNKKVLIVCYYWPPAGGPGVQRWLKFVKYLPEFGIYPIVFVPENPSYAIVDEELLNEIPSGVSVIKNPIKEPYRFASLLSRKQTKTISSGILPKEEKQSFIQRLFLYIRGNFFIPDARVSWVKPSVKRLRSFIEEERIDTIITTGPPHSLHLIGLKLKALKNIKWIADFRDPWTGIDYFHLLPLTSFAKKKHFQQDQHAIRGGAPSWMTVCSPHSAACSWLQFIQHTLRIAGVHWLFWNERSSCRPGIDLIDCRFSS